MKVYIEKHIPYIKGLLEPYMDVSYLEPEEFTNKALKDVDALVIRTRTQCNEKLLRGTKVRFIASATVGTDHINLDYCQKHNIEVYNAVGANAQGVCDYIKEVVETIQGFLPIVPTIAVIGYGNIGTKVVTMVKYKGFKVLIRDPYKGYDTPLKDILPQADIVTFHVPLNEETCYMGNEDFFNLCKPNAYIINTSRGGIIDERALLKSGRKCIIDCWENEPNINSELLERTTLASYHIAGYTAMGKLRATNMCVEALCNYFKVPQPQMMKSIAVEGDSRVGWLTRITTQLKSNPQDFEKLRNNYILR